LVNAFLKVGTNLTFSALATVGLSSTSNYELKKKKKTPWKVAK
jgi:hypothetical protein